MTHYAYPGGHTSDLGSSAEFICQLEIAQDTCSHTHILYTQMGTSGHQEGSNTTALDCAQPEQLVVQSCDGIIRPSAQQQWPSTYTKTINLINNIMWFYTSNQWTHSQGGCSNTTWYWLKCASVVLWNTVRVVINFLIIVLSGLHLPGRCIGMNQSHPFYYSADSTSKRKRTHCKCCCACLKN